MVYGIKAENKKGSPESGTHYIIIFQKDIEI